MAFFGSLGERPTRHEDTCKARQVKTRTCEQRVRLSSEYTRVPVPPKVRGQFT